MPFIFEYVNISAGPFGFTYTHNGMYRGCVWLHVVSYGRGMISCHSGAGGDSESGDMTPPVFPLSLASGDS